MHVLDNSCIQFVPQTQLLHSFQLSLEGTGYSNPRSLVQTDFPD
jgi:hypothetical protein